MTLQREITNIPYDELTVGQSASAIKKITANEIALFGCLTGDANPVHFDSDYAKNTRFKNVIAHGMVSGSLISGVLGMQLPGPGTIYVNQSLNFCYPVYLDDILTITLTIKEKKAKHRVIINCVCTNQNNQVVTEGLAEVIAPANKMSYQPREIPKCTIN